MENFWQDIIRTYGKDFKKKFNENGYDYMVELGELLHFHLLKENNKYRNALNERSEIKSIVFKGRSKLLDKFDYAAADIEIQYGIANFVMGLKLGRFFNNDEQ